MFKAAPNCSFTRVLTVLSIPGTLEAIKAVKPLLIASVSTLAEILFGIWAVNAPNSS